MSGWLSKISMCSHTSHSDPDEYGDAICADCGSSVRVTLTRAAFMQAANAVRRDPHRSRCVETDEGWVCVTGCPVSGVLSDKPGENE